MNVNDIKNVCVVGAGNMGHQISLLCAIYGYKTVCTDVVPEVLKKAEKFVDTYLPGRVEKGKLTKEQAEARAKHEAEEQGRKFNPSSVKSGTTIYQLAGAGAVIFK